MDGVDPERHMASWDRARLAEIQAELAAATPAPWAPGSTPLVAAGCFVAFERGEQGPGRPGDHGWGGAAVVAEDGSMLASSAVAGVAGARYEPGLLAAREGDLLVTALQALPVRPDVLFVDASGHDHPRRAGMALHLGALLDLPSVGVTHRPLLARGAAPPALVRGATEPLWIGEEEVARWVVTRSGVRPVVAHAGWRTTVQVAAEVVLRFAREARTPEPLRLARCAAREARSRASRTTDTAEA